MIGIITKTYINPVMMKKGRKQMGKRNRRDDSDLLEEMREGLSIDKHSLDTEIQRQPTLFFRVSEEFVKAAARRDFLKEKISIVQSELYSKHRRKIEKESGKATEAQVQNAVTSDKAYQETVEKHIQARQRADLLQALKESFHQRSYMLRDLAALHLANYFERDSVSDTGATREVKAKRNQERMAEARDRKLGSRDSRRKRDKD